MAAQKILLFHSKIMDEGSFRNDEAALIRMNGKTRLFLDTDEIALTLVNEENTSKLKLKIYKAFKADIQRQDVKRAISAGEEAIGFVTSDNFNKLLYNSNSNVVLIDEATCEESLLGADPEFLIYDKEHSGIVAANLIVGKASTLGNDGAMGEIRPLPSSTPEGLVKNIHSIFNDKKYTNLMNDYICKAACYEKNANRDFPVGGHIHIGNIAPVLKLPLNLRGHVFQVINKILDEFLAIPMIKLDLGEPGKGRRSSTMSPGGRGYGNFGSYRLAPKGGANAEKRLEYRTLSGMWLMHPTVATSVLGVAKLIVDEIWLKMIEENFNKEYIFPETVEVAGAVDPYSPEFTMWKDLPICKEFNAITDSLTMRNVLKEASPDTINKTFLKAWHENLKEFSLYSKYESYVNLLHDVLSLPIDELIKADKTIQSNWIENKKFII